jgi:hypothetical protein
MRNSMIDIFKIPAFEQDDRFKGLTQQNKVIKAIGIKYGYQIENSPWFIFKNGETVDELVFFDASKRKFFTVEEFIISYSVPASIRTLMTYFLVKLEEQQNS